MKVEKVYRNHQTGRELITTVEKPDDAMMMGVAHVQKFNEHGDLTEECISPNVITDFVKDQIGRFIFNNLAVTRGSAAGGLVAVGAAGPQAIANLTNLPLLKAGLTTNETYPPLYDGMYWPFRYIALSNYAEPESATELYTQGALLASQAASSNVASGFSSVAPGGNSITLTYDWTPTSFAGTVNSVLWCLDPAWANATRGTAQGARTLLPAPIVKTTSDALRVQYVFTYTP